MKTLLSTLLLCFVSYTTIVAQCDTTSIAKDNWSILFVDSEEINGEGTNNGHATHAIDSDSTTFWHTQWQGQQPGYPHELQIDLGQSHAVNGISILSRFDNPYGKPADYEIHLSNEINEWQEPQSIGVFEYANPNAAAQRASVYFGAIEAQYVRIVFLTPAGSDYYTVLSEVDVFEDLLCAPTGQNNQIANFETISQKYTTDPPFALYANTSSGLPITFTVVSGPATITSDTLSLTGEAGTVTIEASQAGDENFYPWHQLQTFEVVDLSVIQPIVTTRFTGDVPLNMHQLSAYLLHAYAFIDEPQQLHITAMEYEIDGETFPATYKNNSYQLWWTPSDYGEHTIHARAFASNGQIAQETVILNVTNTNNNLNTPTFQNDVIDMGTIGSQWFYGSYTLPQFVAAYDTIKANFAISCPNVPGGCDDWDRLAWVEIKAPNGDWIELFRYITPYGVPCHQSIDVTDYASVLQGKVDFRMYIETWGSGGWKLNLNLVYHSGTPQYRYSSIEELWQGDFSFGNPANLQPVDSAVTHFEPGVVAAKMRLVTTGHGWGENNTGNAAEFYHAYHDIVINGVYTFMQDLWQTCNPNPAGCTGQMGTWQYNRAGWCPGSMGKVYFYDLSSYIPQDSILLNYRFQENYMDLCHPNNPNCVSGQTCPDCQASYNPYYRVGGYMIKYGNEPYTLSVSPSMDQPTLTAHLFPNPTRGQFQLNLSGTEGHVVISIQDVSGKLIQTRYFTSGELASRSWFDISTAPKGIYFIKVQSNGNFTTLKVVLN